MANKYLATCQILGRVLKELNLKHIKLLSHIKEHIFMYPFANF